MMDDIPYKEWEKYLVLLLNRYGIAPPSSVLELGCGTGNMSELLAAEGFTVTGIDISEEMLTIAKAKNLKERNITYLSADMRDFTLPKKQAAAISVGDSMNYLLSTEDFTKALTAVHDNLNPGGVFIFDLKTEYFFKTSYDGMTFEDDLGDFSYVWKNYYDDEKRTHEYHLRFKVKDGDGVRFENELHRQRTYSASEIKEAAIKAGFKKAAAYDAFTLNKPRKCSERIYIVCH